MLNAVSLPQLASLPEWIQPTHVQGMRRGIEKESLRMQPDGFLSLQPHPAALGAALTHPHITTDYSESLLELITPPVETPQAALDFLKQLHHVVDEALVPGELLWPLSMPCPITADDASIPLAQYGSSHLGRFKTLYRQGLGLRYGRRMQTIAGIHYNLSFPQGLFTHWQQAIQDQGSLWDFVDARYFGLIRNYFRLLGLLVYLTGASPAVCACFVSGREHTLQRLGKGTLYLPDATSLRMGKLGYQNSAQQSLGIRYDDLAGYVSGIRAAVGTPHAAFAALGLDDAQGEPQQINDHILQIENEYYSPIRPKQIAQAGETPAQALAARGVAYVELRALDLDPYEPLGLGLHTACFAEILALYCLLAPSPHLTSDETRYLQQQLEWITEQGRNQAAWSTTPVMAGWSTAMTQQLAQMQSIAELLDEANQTHQYRAALAEMQARWQDPARLPSARLLREILEAEGMWPIGKALADQHHLAYQQTTPDGTDWAALAAQSREAQRQLEQADQGSFTDYLRAWR